MKNTSSNRQAAPSLATRLTLWYSGTSLVIVCAATAILYWALVTNLDRQDDQFLVDEVHIIFDLVGLRSGERDAIQQEIQWEAEARHFAQVYVRLLDVDGGIIVETPGMNDRLPMDLFPEPISTSLLTGGTDRPATDGTPFRLLSAHFTGPPQNVGTIHVALDRVQRQQLVANYQLTLLPVLLAALVASSFAGYSIAHRGLAPIAEVTATARQVRSTTLHERIETAAIPSELTELIITFNEMLDRLQESFDRLIRFSADIAHELRTPVNNMRGDAEVTLSKPRTVDEYRESLTSNLEETVRLSRIIDSLLLLARAESPTAELEREHFDVPAELERLRQFYEVLMEDADIQFVVQSSPNLQLFANRPLFQRAIGNLVENALTHATGVGQIGVCAFQKELEIHIEVADDGGGIPPDDLPHVFDRFYRVQKDRSTQTGNIGLGLAIVRSIVELHGGNVSISSTLGSGTTVVIAFPIEESE